jgi:hypothetical protein
MFTLATLAVIFAINVAQAASFDCAKAASSVEKAICSNGKLSRLDDEMGEIYTEVLKVVADGPGVMIGQRSWLKTRNKCNDDVCIERMYKVRLDRLHYHLRNAGEPTMSDYAGLCRSLKTMSPKERRELMEESGFKAFWVSPEQSDGRFGYKGRDYVLSYRDKSFEEIYAVSYVREFDRNLYRLCFLGGDEMEVRAPSGEGSHTWDYGGSRYYEKYLASFVRKPADVGGRGRYYVMGRLRWMKPDAQGLDLCDRLAAAFNAVPDAPPMVCEVKFPDSLIEADVPQWQNVSGDAEALAEFKHLVVDEAVRPNEVIEQHLEDMIADGRVTLWRARFRLNPDDIEDVVYQLRRDTLPGKCEYSSDNRSRTAGQPIFRYAASDGLNDKTFYKFNGDTSGGLFLYKGKSYFHHWGYGKSSRWLTYKADYTNEPRITIAESTDGAFGDSFGKVKVCDIGYREY